MAVRRIEKSGRTYGSGTLSINLFNRAVKRGAQILEIYFNVFSAIWKLTPDEKWLLARACSEFGGTPEISEESTIFRFPTLTLRKRFIEYCRSMGLSVYSLDDYVMDLERFFKYRFSDRPVSIVQIPKPGLYLDDHGRWRPTASISLDTTTILAPKWLILKIGENYYSVLGSQLYQLRNKEAAYNIAVRYYTPREAFYFHVSDDLIAIPVEQLGNLPRLIFDGLLRLRIGTTQYRGLLVYHVSALPLVKRILNIVNLRLKRGIRVEELRFRRGSKRIVILPVRDLDSIDYLISTLNEAGASIDTCEDSLLVIGPDSIARIFFIEVYEGAKVEEPIVSGDKVFVPFGVLFSINGIKSLGSLLADLIGLDYTSFLSSALRYIPCTETSASESIVEVIKLLEVDECCAAKALLNEKLAVFIKHFIDQAFALPTSTDIATEALKKLARLTRQRRQSPENSDPFEGQTVNIEKKGRIKKKRAALDF